MGKTRKLQIGDIVKVVKDETGELQDCVGVVVGFGYDNTGEQEANIAVAFGKADNTTPLHEQDTIVHNVKKKWGAYFHRGEIRYSPKLNPSPIRCVPE